jgi:rubrerythrin
MENKSKEDLNALKTAMETELTGYNFYRTAATSITDQSGKEALLSMANEEMEHFKYLQHQYKSILENGDYDFTRKIIKVSREKEENPIFSKDIKSRVKECHFEVSVLSIGMKLELDAINYYRSCAEKANTQEAREIYQELASWEQTHYNAFEKELSRLKEDYWQANNFVPM